MRFYAWGAGVMSGTGVGIVSRGFFRWVMGYLFAGCCGFFWCLSGSYTHNSEVDTMFEKRRQALCEALRDADEDVRQAAAEALERLETVQGLDEILQILKSGNRGQQVRAIFALEKVQSTRVFPPLLAALKVADADIRCAAIQVLAQKRHAKVMEYLVRHLKDPHPAVRVHAACALGNYTDRRLVPFLVAVLESSDEELVVAALDSLGRLAFAEAENAILDHMHDRRLCVRRAAVKALGCLGVDVPVTPPA